MIVDATKLTIISQSLEFVAIIYMYSYSGYKFKSANLLLARPQGIMLQILLIMLFQISQKNPSLCSLLFFFKCLIVIIILLYQLLN